MLVEKSQLSPLFSDAKNLFCSFSFSLKIAGAPPVDTAETTAGEVVDFRGKREKRNTKIVQQQQR